jgi:uncharacterized DUF497 family protein
MLALQWGFAAEAFARPGVEDLRKNYGESRIICYGLLSSRLVVIGYTPRGTTRHIFSMRKANDREKVRLAPYFEIRPHQS